LFESLQVRISGQVFTDPIRTGLLSTDGSIYRIKPVAVVYPASVEDVVQTVRFAGRNALSVHPRGAGSGLCGSALGNGIVLDFTRNMNRLLHLDIQNNWMACEPGYRLGELDEALKGKGLFFPPDPSSGEFASFGGMYATNASGAHSVKYGNVSDYILDAQVVLGTGQVAVLSDILDTPYQELAEPFQRIYDLTARNQAMIASAYPDIRCNTAGYNLRGLIRDGHLDLTRLFAGAEGTLGIVTRLKFRLLPKPTHDALVVAFFTDILSAARAVQEILPLGPSGIEIMDKSLLNLAREHDSTLKNQIPDGIDNVLLIEFDSQSPEPCMDRCRQTQQILTSGGYTENFHIAVTAREKENFWAVRKAAVPILYKLKGEKKILALIEDAAVPTERLVDYFRGIYAILNHCQVSFVVYGHIAKGLLHTRPLLNLKDAADIQKLKPIADSVFDLVSSLGGTVSGEHGDGRLRSAYIRRQYPNIFPLFQEIKHLLDPYNLLNPDIITTDDTGLLVQNLRYGPAYHAADFKDKHLLWPEGFVAEIEKCHGCAKCTTITAATRMCPVYKVTRDESATPRAKANILRMLISGAIDNSLLYHEIFQDVISRCICCGSCFHECPSGVNIPKMAMEARAAAISHFGATLHEKLVVSTEQAAKTAGKVSSLLTPFLDNPAVKLLGEKVTGIASRRTLPRFAEKPFFERIPLLSGSGAPRILYFAGCYAGYLRPSIGEAAISVMTSMGMTVLTPKQHCCGLPMLTKGMTKQSRERIDANFLSWGRLIASVDYLAVSCSSCGLALMQEWGYLEDSVFVGMVRDKLIHISRLINRYSDRLKTAPARMRLFYHAPCHLKVQPEPDSSIQLLRSLKGAVIKSPATRCCGMAGAWGLSKNHFDLSLVIGSDMISQLNASGADAGVTDCPTCAMQMTQFSRKPIRHPVEILADHLRNPACLSEQDRASDSVPDSTKETLYGKNTDCRR
jgi:FAD/FMN-containing dehydrogenase/Fe-S oxidoreductase